MPGGRALRTTGDRAMRCPLLEQTTQSLQTPTGMYPILGQCRLQSPQCIFCCILPVEVHLGLSSALPRIPAAFAHSEEAAAFRCAVNVQDTQATHLRL